MKSYLLLFFSSCAILVGSETRAAKASNLVGLPGSVSDISVAVPAPIQITPVTAGALTDDINLKLMAQWAMNYLILTPRPALNYEPVFRCNPLVCPPTPAGHDVVVPCDTDARMNWEWYFMREVSGSTAGLDVENKFHQRMLSYVEPDGTVLAPLGAYNEGAIHKVYTKAEYSYHIWGATKILFALAEDYRRTQNPESKKIARQIMLRLKQEAVFLDPTRCYFRGGMGAVRQDGTVVQSNWNKNPAPIVLPLLNYYRATGDAEALQFAKAYAEGVIAGSQPDGVRFGADGNYIGGHGHTTMHALWGIAELGLETGDPRYIAFVKRSWDWMLTQGTGTGWFPAKPPFHPTDETCLTSDMMSVAACIAQAGHPEYYDFVERYLRNRIRPMQFFVTPEFEVDYRQRNAAAGEPALDAGIAELRKFQGAIQSYIGLDDFENSRLKGKYMRLAGCCASEGMRAIYTTWTNTIQRRTDSLLGPEGVYVNLSFGRASPWGRTISRLPASGELTVVCSVSDTFYLRPPHWAPQEQVRAFVNGREVSVTWSGSYVRFDSAKPGDQLSIGYPLLQFTHAPTGPWKEKMQPVVDLTYTWVGNTVVDSSPAPIGRSVFNRNAPATPLPPDWITNP